MHKWVFVFQKKSEFQSRFQENGSVEFPDGITPYVPKIGDVISYKASDGETVWGLVHAVFYEYSSEPGNVTTKAIIRHTTQVVD